MKSYLNIKGKNLWKLCALIVLGIAINACYIRIQNINQPATANVNDIITIQLQDTIQTNIGGAGYVNANYVLGMLMPKGWDALHNVQSINYVSGLGNGTMAPMPLTTIEPANGKNLNWPNAMLAKFGIGRNLVNDVEWVVFESTVPYTINNEIKIRADATIKLKVGADGNDTYAFPAYCIAESTDGLNDDIVNGSPNPMYNEASGGCLMVENGTTGDIHDYCNPQLASVTPPKALDNEFITITYNNALLTSNNPLAGNTNLYLCVDSAITSDGKDITNYCIQTEQSQFVETSATSNIFNLTIWPRSYFGLTASQTLTKLVYHVTDATGTKRVGYGGSATTPFVFKFGCN